MKALILTSDEFEEAELLVPYYRLLEENIAVDVAAPKRGAIRGKHGYPFEANRSLAEIDPNQYAVLIVPGGGAAEVLSEDRQAIRIAAFFLEEDKLAAAICHGPLLLIATGLMEERHATGHVSTAFALRAARVHYDPALPVVVDDHVITARQPADLPAFMREVIKHTAMMSGRSVPA